MLSFFNDNIFKKSALLFLSLIFGGFSLLLPSATHAQVATTTTQQKQSTITLVKSNVGITGNAVTAADVAGMTKCSGSIVAAGSCGEVATASGNYDFVNFNKGDILKCGGTLNVYCAVTNSSGTTYEYSGPLAKDSAQTDLQGNIIGGGTQTAGAAAVSTAAGAAGAAINGALDSGTGGCGISSFSNIGQCIVDAIGPPILGISTFILGIAGVLFNLVMVKTVFEFSQLIGNAPGLLLAWGILRDIGNMALLFGFIFMGLTTILDLHTYNAKKALPQLIIFAILMNFSLFAAEAVIDTSNAFSSIMYSQANTSPCGFSGTVNATQSSNLAAAELSNKDCINNGIGGSIMQASGLSTLYGVDAKNIGLASIAVYIGLSLFAIIGAIVMIAASIMLVFRAVTLTLLMVVAPIGFAGMAIPPMRNLASRWWSTLMHQAFFAPILLLLILISLKVTEGLSTVSGGGATGTGLAAALTAPNSSTMGIILVFVIVIGFLIGSLKAATSFGAMGASFAVNTASGLVFGLAARGTNAVGGGAGYGLRRFTQKVAPNSKVGRALVNYGFRPLEKANLDARRVPGMGKVLGLAGVTSGAKPAENATFGDLKHQFEDIRDGKGGKERNRQYDAEVAIQKLETEAHRADAEGIPMSDESKKYLNSLSEKELMELHGIKEGVASMAENLTSNQFNKLMDNKDLTDAQKNTLRNGRFASLSTTLADAAANPANTAMQDAAKKAVNDMSGKDLEQLARTPDHSSLYNNPSFTSLLTDDQFKDAMKNEGLSRDQRKTMTDTRNARLNDPVQVAAKIPNLNAEAIGKLSGDALSDTRVLNAMTGRQLAAIDTTKMTPVQETAIAAYLRAERTLGTPRWTEFNTVAGVNPKVRSRWAGLI